jgi:hypothetical protein
LTSTLFPLIELQALGDDLLEEEEMPSYLKDTTALPDFVDEAPVDAEKVSCACRKISHVFGNSRDFLHRTRHNLK